MSGTAWVVLELSEGGVAEFFVEGASLKAEGVEINADAVGFDGDLLGLVHELGAYAGSAKRFGNDEVFDVEPIVDDLAEEAAGDVAVGVDDVEDNGDMAERRSGLKVELLQRLGDGEDVFLGRFFFAGDCKGQDQTPNGLC